MHAVRKKIVTDENHQPVEVVISYQDWLEIERLLELQSEERLVTDLSAFRGAITLTEDPADYQRRVRDEWPS